MKFNIPICIAAFTVSYSAAIFSQEAFVSNKLEKVWETPSGLNVPESSCYNPENGLIYVSNIVGIPNVKDSTGYISKINDKGQFIEKEWVKGLSAPKGIGISKNKLFVTDIDEVKEIDLNTGKILKRYKNSTAKSVNDITVDANGNVYVSDTKTKSIFIVGKDSLEIFVESEEIGNVNGLWVNKNQLLLGSKGNLIAIDLKTKGIKVLSENTGYIDGIVTVGENKIIISDWKGKIQLVEPGKGIEKLLDTTPIHINAADLGFIPSQNILLVPTFIDNKVIAYKLKL